MSKKKRCPSGYNLYTQKCAKETGDFMGCVKSGDWKKLSDEKQAEWKNTAKEQCIK